MFGTNEIVGKNYFEKNKLNELMITTIFYTIQGEGPFSGELATFVRGTKCNLACSFCDTFFNEGDIRTFDQIFDQIKKVIENFYINQSLEIPQEALRNPLIVVTGGEPLLQKNFVPFLNEAHERGYRTQIESNGIIYQDIPKETTLVISPKLNERITKYIKPKAENLKRADALKFVISSEMPGYTDIPEFGLDWFKDRTDYKKNMYVSPMNIYLEEPTKLGNNATLEQRSEVDERISFWTPNLLDPVKNQANHEYAAFIAMKYGCKLSLQTHLYASLP